MRLVVQILLFRILVQMLARQLYLKFTKFTRRTREPKDFLRKIVRGYGFFMDMVRYNLEVVRRSRYCLDKLAEQGVREAAIYGERPILEVLCQMASAGPVKIKRIDPETETRRPTYDVKSADHITKCDKAVIVASLIDIDRKKERLLKMGVEEERMVVLVDSTSARGGK